MVKRFKFTSNFQRDDAYASMCMESIEMELLDVVELYEGVRENGYQGFLNLLAEGIRTWQSFRVCTKACSWLGH